MATNNKYDRQLRLWGAAGQKALSETCVVLIRATAAGTETLKNLVLPGVGEIFVLDDAKVGNEYASNFFLVNEPSESRAKMATEYLRELNPDVQGSWKDSIIDQATVESILSRNDKQLLVVASDLEPPLLEMVSKVCQQKQVPLLSVTAYGLIGIVRLQASKPLPIFNPKPRDSRPDLRLTDPFPKLVALEEGIDWKSLDDKDHGHVPYPLILLRAAKEWKRQHGNQLPGTFQEKQEFQQSIKAMSRDFNDELNFQEAQTNAYLAYAPQELDLEHLAHLRDSTDPSSVFHKLLLGLDQFLKGSNNQAPIKGTIPDMTASSEKYIQLQKVYLEQAELDLKRMRECVDPSVSDDDLATFCQNVFHLDLVQTRSIVEEYHEKANDEISGDLAMATFEGDERPDQLPLLWYLGFRACQSFYNAEGRYPGTTTDYANDVETVHEKMIEIVKQYGLEENNLIHETLVKSTDYAVEMTRYGNAQVHNIASVIGGVASQEAVKIITGQYTPFNDTYVYNGIASIGGVYRF